MILDILAIVIPLVAGYLFGFYEGYKSWPSKPTNKKHLKEDKL